MTIQIQLTPEQTTSIIALDTLAEGQIAAAAKATPKPDRFVFFAAFDGTNNDSLNEGNATTTNVADIHPRTVAINLIAVNAYSTRAGRQNCHLNCAHQTPIITKTHAAVVNGRAALHCSCRSGPSIKLAMPSRDN